MDAPQVCVDTPAADGEMPKRLAGSDKVGSKPGGQATVSAAIDPWLVAVFDVAANRWRSIADRYTVGVGRSSGDAALRDSPGMAAPA